MNNTVSLRRSAASIGLAAIASEFDAEARADQAAGLQPAADPVEAYAPKPQVPPIPEYVAHVEGATRAGMLSAAAVVAEYEATAREIEALGEDLKNMEEKAQAAATTLTDALYDLRKTAVAYREEAARVFTQIENMTAKASEARTMVMEMQAKVVNG